MPEPIVRFLRPRAALAFSLALFAGSSTAVAGPAAPDLSGLPVLSGDDAEPAGVDWLIASPERGAGVWRSSDGREIVMANGLARRVWRVVPACATVALDDLARDASLLRSPRPEARLVIDGKPVAVGGLRGQIDHAWLDPAWLDRLEGEPGALRLVRAVAGKTTERTAWKRARHHAPRAAWPPPGVSLRLDFTAPEDRAELAGIEVSVHYELYDGIPAFQKWITVRNGSGRAVDVDRFTAEILAMVERGNEVETRDGVALLPPDSLHVETDYAFGGFTVRNATRLAIHWKPDPRYKTQVNYLRQNPCLLEVAPERGPDVTLAPGAVFESFRVFELVQDSSDRERRGLALRRLYRTVAPWVTENPLILHVVSVDPAVVRRAIDQAAECGFEMVSLSFGSGLDMEDDRPANHAKFRALADYARSRGIQLGGYSLLASRRIRPESDNCINPETGKPGGQTFGYCPALASGWGQAYFRKLRAFFERTGFLQFTHDGSYPGDLDAAARPPLQKGADDSRWVQWRIITGFYRWLRARGAYLRVPDYYYLSGANECGMGYRETNWSLPRDLQVIHARQNIFDGTWEKTPSMGWMFAPLTQYHGGGAAATIEPLDEHLDHYDRMLSLYLGLGVQAVYRGRRLYDTPRVRDLVRERVAWYRRHRDILESDLVHGRRADGRDLDWMLHANPWLQEKGMLLVFNPLAEPRRRRLRIDVYYTGLEREARVRPEGGEPLVKPIGRDHRIELEVEVEARGMRWFVIE